MLDFYKNYKENFNTPLNFLDINKNCIFNCKDDEYPKEFFEIPVSKNQMEIDTCKGLLKYCEFHRSGPRVARLSNEMSKIVKIAED